MSFKVIVDSCCDLTPSLLREEDFLSVPLTIRVGDHVVVDDASFDQADLLWRMKECETAPQTSCPAPAQYLDAFACGADDLYVITLSALLSGSHNSAQQARQLWLEEHPQARVHIFNSCSASAGEVLLALKVRELAAKGLTYGDIAAHFEQIYGASISKDTISRITATVLDQMNEWAARPLETVYLAVFIDAIYLKVREGQVSNRPFYVAMGVNVEGARDVLGIWAGP